MITELKKKTSVCKVHGFGYLTLKDFLCLWVGYWKVQKGKGTLRPYFSRRLRENERTLATLTLGIEEAFSNEVEVISDLNELDFIMNELSRDLKTFLINNKGSSE